MRAVWQETVAAAVGDNHTVVVGKSLQVGLPRFAGEGAAVDQEKGLPTAPAVIDA